MKKWIAGISVFAVIVGAVSSLGAVKLKRAKFSRKTPLLRRIEKQYPRLVRERTYEAQIRADRKAESVLSSMGKKQKFDYAHVEFPEHPTYSKVLKEETKTSLKERLEQFTAYAEKLREQSKPQPVEVPTVWKEMGGKTLYTNSEDLISDVVKFYGNRGGQAYKSVLGDELVLYELPPGISYHPQRAVLPRLLNPQEEYVMYNPLLGSGNLVKKDILSFYTKVENAPAKSSLKQRWFQRGRKR